MLSDLLAHLSFFCHPGFPCLGCEAGIIRQMSSDSMSSINSLSSACSAASQQSAATDGDIGKKKNKKKGWVSNIVSDDARNKFTPEFFTIPFETCVFI